MVHSPDDQPLPGIPALHFRELLEFLDRELVAFFRIRIVVYQSPRQRGHAAKVDRVLRSRAQHGDGFPTAREATLLLAKASPHEE
jgi:hypothetical protein